MISLGIVLSKHNLIKKLKVNKKIVIINTDLLITLTNVVYVFPVLLFSSAHISMVCPNFQVLFLLLFCLFVSKYLSRVLYSVEDFSVTAVFHWNKRLFRLFFDKLLC